MKLFMNDNSISQSDEKKINNKSQTFNMYIKYLIQINSNIEYEKQDKAKMLND